MIDQQVRQEVIDAFDPNDYYYYHTTTKEHSDFIDTMAWVGLCCGAAYKAGDTEVAKLCENNLKQILKVGYDARNFVNRKLNDKYIESTTMPGYFYRSGQSFAGPAGLQFAIENGADLQSPYDIGSKISWFTFSGSFFGFFARYITSLRQHINSVFLSYLIENDRPPKSMRWMAEHNPFYSAICRKIVIEEYPPMNKTTEGKTVERKEIVPLVLRKPSSWLFRGDPYSEYVRDGDPMDWSYTPISQLTADYLIETLK